MSGTNSLPQINSQGLQFTRQLDSGSVQQMRKVFWHCTRPKRASWDALLMQIFKVRKDTFDHRRDTSRVSLVSLYS